MIAEIKHKMINNIEDELTGNFFGNLRYLDSKKYLLPILINSIKKESGGKDILIKNLSSFDNKVNFEFWKKHKEGEIDGYFTFSDASVGIEVKLDSGLSSEDQLIRESNMLNYWSRIDGKKDKLLFFITRDCQDCNNAYINNVENCKKTGVELIWCTWENIYESLQEVVNDIENNEKTIIKDLIALLIEKGFDGFKDFKNCVDNKNMNIDITKEYRYNKDLVIENVKYNFINNNIIKEDLYYEYK